MLVYYISAWLVTRSVWVWSVTSACLSWCWGAEDTQCAMWRAAGPWRRPSSSTPTCPPSCPDTSTGSTSHQTSHSGQNSVKGIELSEELNIISEPVRYENGNSREYLESLVQQTREMLKIVSHAPSVQMTDTENSDLDQPKRAKWTKLNDNELK